MRGRGNKWEADTSEESHRDAALGGGPQAVHFPPQL